MLYIPCTLVISKISDKKIISSKTAAYENLEIERLLVRNTVRKKIEHENWKKQCIFFEKN